MGKARSAHQPLPLPACAASPPFTRSLLPTCVAIPRGVRSVCEQSCPMSRGLECWAVSQICWGKQRGCGWLGDYSTRSRKRPRKKQWTCSMRLPTLRSAQRVRFLAVLHRFEIQYDLSLQRTGFQSSPRMLADVPFSFQNHDIEIYLCSAPASGLLSGCWQTCPSLSKTMILRSIFAAHRLPVFSQDVCRRALLFPKP
jgi:hypothetical protein